jgi:uncharacterized repeat protein (TIGR01451 family)
MRKGKSMKWIRTVAFLGVMSIALPGTVQAAGTPAGTSIQNSATADFIVGTTPVSETSNTETITVAELLDVDVTLQTVGNVTVAPGDTNQVLTFLVTNIGNGTDDYTLGGLSTLGGDDFDPSLVDLYLDNGDATYVPADDPQYIPGVNDPALVADGDITIFVLNDIPIPPLADGDLGDSQLTATSNAGTGAPGTVIINGGDGGTYDAVIGTNGGDDAEIGTYVVSNVTLTITKTSAVLTDPFGGTSPVPGATVRYSLVITAAGTGTAQAVVVTDSIPANTTFVAASMTLNATPQTDADDAPTDNGDFNITNGGAITEGLGDLTGASPVQTITFDVTID